MLNHNPWLEIYIQPLFRFPILSNYIHFSFPFRHKRLFSHNFPTKNHKKISKSRVDYFFHPKFLFLVWCFSLVLTQFSTIWSRSSWFIFISLWLNVPRGDNLTAVNHGSSWYYDLIPILEIGSWLISHILFLNRDKRNWRGRLDQTNIYFFQTTQRR